MPGSPQSQDPFESVRYWGDQRLNKGWWHSFELPDGTLIDGVCGVESLRERIAQFPIPADLRGKRVLDVGTWDGWFAFEMERRGAEVVAIDNWDNPRFHEVHDLLRSRVHYRQIEVYDLTPESVGQFDIVLFMGVLYHLKHPLLALERVCALTKDVAAVESFILTPEHSTGSENIQQSIVHFYETDEMGGQLDNWSAPNLSCLLAFCRTAGFARVILQNVTRYGAAVSCYRAWPPPSPPINSAPELLEAVHSINGGINFSGQRDDYMTARFRSHVANLGLDEVRPRVGDYGVRPIYVTLVAPLMWQVNFKLPPGLSPGWHEVTMSLQNTSSSKGTSIAVDVSSAPGLIRVASVHDSGTWKQGCLDLRLGHFLSLWIEGLPANADRNNVRVYCNHRRLSVTYVAPANHDEPRQVNVRARPDTASGIAQIQVAVGEKQTSICEILVAR